MNVELERAGGILRHRILGTAVLAIGLLLVVTSTASALSRHTLSSSLAGEGATALSNPTDVAVDQSTGALYVVDNGNHRVVKFDSSGQFILMVGQEVNRTMSEDPDATWAEKLDAPPPRATSANRRSSALEGPRPTSNPASSPTRSMSRSTTPEVCRPATSTSRARMSIRNRRTT